MSESAVLTDRTEITEALNEHFTSIGPNLANKLAGETPIFPTPVDYSFNLLPMSPEDVANIIRSLDNWG